MSAIVQLQAYLRQNAHLWFDAVPLSLFTLFFHPTQLPFRRRGIATTLTSQAVAAAFRQGVHTICLTAEDARAGRVYKRVGFKPTTTISKTTRLC